MDCTWTTASPAELDVDMVGMVLADDGSLPAGGDVLDTHVGGAVTRGIAREEITAGRPGWATFTGAASGPHRVAVATTGDKDLGHIETLRLAGGRLAAATRARKAHSFALLAGDADASEVAAIVEGFILGAYRYAPFKTSDSAQAAVAMPELTVHSALEGAERDLVQRSIVLATATNHARDLGNAPGNVLRPADLAAEAQAIADRHPSVRVEILDRAAIEERGFGMIEAVARGSEVEPRLIVMHYEPQGHTDDAPLGMVGKAVTFDSGGISIKPSAGMGDMRMDKCGGCAVVAAIDALATLGVERHVIGFVPAAENMPGGRAYRPGDVITAYDGTTVEITNTDAEGRLILGDAISYARELGCSELVEMSTLTGAMVIALGHHFAGAVAYENEWLDQVMAAAEASGDHAWHLPMHNAYRSSLKSEFADILNAGARPAAPLSAALFLQHFAKDTPFVHLDIAGVAMLPKPSGYHTVKGSSGWGVRLLVDLAEQG